MPAVALVLLVVVGAESTQGVEPRGDQGSVPGPWALVTAEGRGTLAFQQVPLGVTDTASALAVGGLGFDFLGAHWSSTAAISGTMPVPSPLPLRRPASRPTWSPLFVELALPLSDARTHALNVMPFAGFTVPTAPESFDGHRPLTGLSFGVQVRFHTEWSESALRLDGTRYLTLADCVRGVPGFPGACTVDAWLFGPEFKTEVWMRPWVSVGVDLSWKQLTRESVAPPRSCSACFFAEFGPMPTTTASGAFFVTWALTRFFGISIALRLGATATSFEAAMGMATRTIGITVSPWLRTDPRLAPNWIDR